MVWSLHKIDLVAVGDGGGCENRRENQNDGKPWKVAENDGQCWLNEIDKHPRSGCENVLSG